MENVVFVVPFGLETSLRFVRGACKLSGVRLGIISQEPPERLPKDIRGAATQYVRVQDAMDVQQLTRAVRTVAKSWGGKVDRLIGILEQLQEPLAEVRVKLGIRGMDVEEAENFRDKAKMKEALRKNGLPCARHFLAKTSAEALSYAEECLPLVAKPPAGAGAKNTFRIESREQLANYLRTEPILPGEPMLLEEFIHGREHSFDSVTVDRKHVFHSISRYYPTPLEVMESPWIQWCVLLPRSIDGPEFDDIREAGRKALDVLGMVTGLTHMEWFRRKDGSIAISEVAARPPGAQFTTLLSVAHDIDFYRAWAELMIFNRFAVPERAYATGAVFLRGQGRGRVKEVLGMDELEKELGSMVFQARLPKLGQSQASTYEGEGFIILRHPETEAVERGLDRVLNLIKIRLA